MPLLPPEELVLDDQSQITVEQCDLMAHNAGTDGKAWPIDSEDPRFIFVYRCGELGYFLVTGLNPEMMNAESLTNEAAADYIEQLPFHDPDGDGMPE